MGGEVCEFMKLDQVLVLEIMKIKLLPITIFSTSNAFLRIIYLFRRRGSINGKTNEMESRMNGKSFHLSFE